jgi:chromosome segregation ATPase
VTHTSCKTLYSRTLLPRSLSRARAEVNDLRENRQKWVDAYGSLEKNYVNMQKQVNEISNRLSLEQKKRIQLEEYLEELDLELLLYKIRTEIRNNKVGLHDGIDSLINEKRYVENKYQYALEYVNLKLPEEYDLFYDLGEALEAFYGYYEDHIEELSDE